MVKRVSQWMRAPEPRVSYDAIAADGERRRERLREREAEFRRLPGWVRLAPLLYYSIPVVAFLGFVHGQWMSAFILASCGLWIAAWPLEFWWRRHDGKRRQAPASAWPQPAVTRRP